MLTTSRPNAWSSSGRRWEAASAMQGSMAHCGPQTSSQSCPTQATTRSPSIRWCRRSSSASSEPNRRQSDNEKRNGKTVGKGKNGSKLLVAMTGKASAAKAAEGDKPVFDYIASLPQPQSGIAERIDAVAAKTLQRL